MTSWFRAVDRLENYVASRFAMLPGVVNNYGGGNKSYFGLNGSFIIGNGNIATGTSGKDAWPSDWTAAPVSYPVYDGATTWDQDASYVVTSYPAALATIPANMPSLLPLLPVRQGRLPALGTALTWPAMSIRRTTRTSPAPTTRETGSTFSVCTTPFRPEHQAQRPEPEHQRHEHDDRRLRQCGRRQVRWNLHPRSQHRDHALQLPRRLPQSILVPRSLLPTTSRFRPPRQPVSTGRLHLELQEVTTAWNRRAVSVSTTGVVTRSTGLVAARPISRDIDATVTGPRVFDIGTTGAYAPVTIDITSAGTGTGTIGCSPRDGHRSQPARRRRSHRTCPHRHHRRRNLGHHVLATGRLSCCQRSGCGSQLRAGALHRRRHRLE